MIKFIDFSFRYDGMPEDALKHINLEIKDGAFILLTGRSGCGKSTVLRALNGLIPHFYPGRTSGEVLYNGRSLLETDPSETAGIVGTVFQDPRSQFFMTDTTRELAFGCMNMGYTREEIIDRVEKAVTELELEAFLNRSIFSLSSGEKQQIAIGSVYALSPAVYIFDEPSANLDHEAIRRLTCILKKLREEGHTVIVADHRYYYLRDLIDTALYIENGQITAGFTREEFCGLDEAFRLQKGLRAVYPEKDIGNSPRKPVDRGPENEKHVFRVEGLSFGYEKGTNILDQISFEASSGDVIGIVGHNGAGKTTLLSVLTGILREKAGSVYYDGIKLSPAKRRKLSYLVMQDADYQLFTASVEEELVLGMTDIDRTLLDDTLDRLALSEYRDRHPASLSEGQKQRVTIGASIMKNSKILYFDEPTSGLDHDSMVRVSRMIKDLSDKGAVIFVVSHDLEFIMNTCTGLLDLDPGQTGTVTEVGEEVFGGLLKKYQV